MPTSLGDSAVAYAVRGWPVFPCEPAGKQPLGRLVPNGFKDASISVAKIREWWNEEPEANVGLPTGLAFDVLDVDSPEALKTLSEVQAGRDANALWTVKTPRGWHLYYQPSRFRNRAGLLPGVDFRGDGGYVVAPPSRTDAGRYEHLGASRSLGVLPDWLRELVERPRVSVPHLGGMEGGSSESLDPYVRSAIERECGRIILAPEGTRNDTLNRAAYALGQLVAGGALGVQSAETALGVAAAGAGLNSTEINRTIQSGLQSGAREPRGIPERD